MADLLQVVVNPGVGFFDLDDPVQVDGRGDHHGIDTVHDPLVMGYGPVGFAVGDRDSLYDFSGEVFP